MADEPEVEPNELPPGYPAMWETHAVLADGTPVEMRPVRPSDRALIATFHKRQSAESIYFRFFQHRPELSDRELDYFTRVDYVARMAFVALIAGELVAVARYESGSADPRPEVAFFVDDSHHGRGLATLLLEYLAAAARSRGLTGFTASVLAENYAMLGVFRRAGFGVKTRFESGVIEVELDIRLTESTSTAIAERQSRARSRSVARLLRPASVAVVGAGRRPGSVGHALLANLIDGGFTGEIFPVNPRASELFGHRCWPSLDAIGQPVDLAVIAVPAASVEEVMAQAVAHGVGAVLIVSSGFSDVGPAGVEREKRLAILARNNGMRLVGPNAFGLVNTAADIRLRALFLPIGLTPGRVALMSESGPLGGAVLERIGRSGVGISSFVAAGNRADVSVNDLLDYWLLDDHTNVVLLYVENYGNLRTFARTARTVSLRKPIVAVRPPDEDLVEILSRAGVVLVDGVAGLEDMAQLAASQPLPAGRRVAVVSNAASVARLAVAACRRYGLEVVLPSGLVSGPVPEGVTTDVAVPEAFLVADVDVVVPDEERRQPNYDQILVAAAASAEVDAVLVALVPTLELSLDALSALLDRVNRSIPKPLVAAGLVDPGRLAVPDLPVYTFPEEAARSLGRLAEYAEWRRRATDPSQPDAEAPVVALEAAARPAVRELLGDHEERTLSLWSPELPALARLLGLPVPAWRLAGSCDEATAAADAVGYPVVLKAASTVRRTVGEAGGTAIDLHDREQLRSAYERMLAARGPAMVPVVVQKLIRATANVKVELHQDPIRGAFMLLGLGGSVGDALPPVARRHLPLMQGEAAELVELLSRSVPLDDAARAVLENLIQHLSVVAGALPELACVQLDPILVAGGDTVAADLDLVLRPVRPDPLSEVRRI